MVKWYNSTLPTGETEISEFSPGAKRLSPGFDSQSSHKDFLDRKNNKKNILSTIITRVMLNRFLGAKKLKLYYTKKF